MPQVVKLGKEESPAPTQLNGTSLSPAPTIGQPFQSPAVHTEIKTEPTPVKAASVDKSFMYSTKVSSQLRATRLPTSCEDG